MANQLKQKQQAVILDSVTRLWKTGMMADIELQCAGGVVSAHKSFLRAVSPFFDALISKTTSDARLDRIQFDFKVNAMKTVVDFLYSGEIPEELNEDLVSITEILAIAHVMDITLLFDHYWVMFNDLLSTSNFLLHLVTAEEYGQQNTVNEVITFMVDNLEDVTREDSFNQLNKDQMEKLIQLAVEKKIQAEVVVLCILKWGEFNQEGRSRIILKWIEFVGLSKLSNIQLQGLFQNALVKNCDELNKILVTEAIHRLSITESVNDSTKTLHIRVTSITIENGRAKEEIQRYDTQEKLWTTVKTVSFPQEQYSSLYVILNPDGEPYYFTRNSNNEIVAYNPLYNRSVAGCIFSRRPSLGVAFMKTFCFLDDGVIAQYCTESEQWKTIKKPLTSINNCCTLMSCCAELFLYELASNTLHKYDFNHEEWCTEAISSEPLDHVWSKCLSQSCQRRLFFTNGNHVLTTYDTKTKEWKKYPNCDLVNGSVLLASCDDLFVTFSKQNTLMFYNCESDTTECLPSGGISGISDYYLK